MADGDFLNAPLQRAVTPDRAQVVAQYGLEGRSTSGTSSSATSSSQDSVFDIRRCTESPVTERSGSTSEELRGNPMKRSTETENKSKNEGHEDVQSDLLHDLEIGHENNPLEPQENSNSSHELPMEPRAKVEHGSGKHSLYTHFPKDPSCDICLKTKITRPSCRRRAGTVVPKAENVGDLITADHKVLSEESESRNSHRYAVVVQDLATQWIQSYPCKTKTSQETQKSLQKFMEPTRKPKVICTDTSMDGKTVILFVDMV